MKRGPKSDKPTCVIPGCDCVAHSLQRCYKHRPDMTDEEIKEAFAYANAAKSAAKMGSKNPMYGKTGEKHHRWVPETQASYDNIHGWLSRMYGRPKACEVCGTTDPSKRYEWANITGTHCRDRMHYRRMCKKCHNNFDDVNGCQQSSAEHPQTAKPMRKRGEKPVSSRYKGVRATSSGTWRATLTVDKKITNLGTFTTEEAAARAYNAAVVEQFGDNAYLNDVNVSCG